MEGDGHLEAGQQLSLCLDCGTELFCARGTLRVVPHFSQLGLALAPLTLRAGQGWRAGGATQLTVLAETAVHYRVLNPRAVPKSTKPRRAGLWLYRLLVALRRGRRAA